MWMSISEDIREIKKWSRKRRGKFFFCYSIIQLSGVTFGLQKSAPFLRFLVVLENTHAISKKDLPFDVVIFSSICV